MQAEELKLMQAWINSKYNGERIDWSPSLISLVKHITFEHYRRKCDYPAQPQKENCWKVCSELHKYSLPNKQNYWKKEFLILPALESRYLESGSKFMNEEVKVVKGLLEWLTITKIRRKIRLAIRMRIKIFFCFRAKGADSTHYQLSALEPFLT